MSDFSKIEWTDSTWNPVTGCTKVSPGCDHCYAETFAERWRGTPGHHFENGFDVTLRPERLDQPLKWRKPKRVFVNSMSDLFHDAVPEEFIVTVFARMWWSPQHTFQVLTKRHGRMRSLMPRVEERLREMERDLNLLDAPTPLRWPLPNVWLGVSVEDQKRADLRIPALLDTPAAVRWLSCEPLLGPVDLGNVDWDGATGLTVLEHPPNSIDWVIVGGESGPGARPMHPAWVRSLRDQCQAAGVPYFFKQWGNWRPQPIYSTDDRHHVVMPDGRDRGTPWPGWGIDQPDAVVMERVGKKAAGRELDGRTWDEFPAVAS